MSGNCARGGAVSVYVFDMSDDGGVSVGPSIIGTRTPHQLGEQGPEEFFLWLEQELRRNYPDVKTTGRSGPKLILPPWAEDYPGLVQGLWEFGVFQT